MEETGELSNCAFVVTVESHDIDYMLYHDSNHEASIVGTVTCPALSDKPLTISSGIHLLFYLRIFISAYAL